MSGLLNQEIDFQSFEKRTPEIPYGQYINDRFLVRDTLENGGMACVYDAMDDDTGNAIALKVPRLGEAEIMEGFVERFVREAEITQAMSAETENSVPYVDAGIAIGPGSPILYLATEKMAGGSLAGRVGPQAGKIVVSDMLQIVTPAFAALGDLHDANLVHRDVKPGNILIDAEGNGKLADYGIIGFESFEPAVLEEHHISPDLFQDSITRTDTYVGTPAMLAPEILLQQSGFTKASDVFAAGLTLDSVLKGEVRQRVKLPATQDYIDFLTGKKELKTDLVYDYAPSVPEDLGNLALSCMEANPANRPTIQEAVQVLQAA